MEFERPVMKFVDVSAENKRIRSFLIILRNNVLTVWFGSTRHHHAWEAIPWFKHSTSFSQHFNLALFFFQNNNFFAFCTGMNKFENVCHSSALVN